MATSTSMSSIFAQKKAKILSQLTVPEGEYSDLSPKGSVDAGIRDLIDEINALEGVVTTSSCAGRVSVYLEGHKALKKGQKSQVSQLVVKLNSSSNPNEHGDGGDIADERNPSSSAAGGKGGGQWLFVSHDPLPESPSMVTLEGDDSVTKSWSTIFDLEKTSTDEKIGSSVAQEYGEASPPRLVHFKFEPMILHVLTASHELAQLVVQAGMEAGFRETGAVSLLPKHQSKDKEDTSSGTPTPIVAVRSMGLSFESLIGMETPDGKRTSLVSPDYLELLVKISHERFAENQKRIARFREALKTAFAGSSLGSGDAGGKKKNVPEGWEDSEARRERKRLEGLRRKEELARQKEQEQEEQTKAADQGGVLDIGLVLEVPDIL